MLKNFNISRSCRRPSANRWRYAAEKVLSGVFWGQGMQPGNGFFQISRRCGDIGGAKVGLPLTAMLKWKTCQKIQVQRPSCRVYTQKGREFGHSVTFIKVKWPLRIQSGKGFLDTLHRFSTTGGLRP